jgi:hypothetical protein
MRFLDAPSASTPLSKMAQAKSASHFVHSKDHQTCVPINVNRSTERHRSLNLEFAVEADWASVVAQLKPKIRPQGHLSQLMMSDDPAL